MEENYQYKFRAECVQDVDNLKERLPGRYDVQFMEGFPDVEVRLSTNLNLNEVLKVMETVPDGHVMLETVEHEEEYTGVRKYFRRAERPKGRKINKP